MPHPKKGYRNKDNKRVPGVTTIIGRFKESGALLHWAFNQGKLAEQGAISNLYDKRDEAADIGTAAHDMVERHINGDDPSTVLSELDGKAFVAANTAFEAYLEWESMSKMKILEQEMQLVSEEYQFGGCPDALGEINGKIVLVDWKTSKGVYADYLIQLAAYGHLIEECMGTKVEGFHLCKFSKETADFSHHYWGSLEKEWRQFVLFREAYENDKQIKKRVG